jgi:hypothetical protein
MEPDPKITGAKMTALEAAIREFLSMLLAGTGAEAEVTIHVTVRAGKEVPMGEK